jgi:hypothetical protein
MGEAAESGERRQQALRIDADRLAQRQCRHRVGDVVSTDEPQVAQAISRLAPRTIQPSSRP